jgi:hypothetical protein
MLVLSSRLAVRRHIWWLRYVSHLHDGRVVCMYRSTSSVEYRLCVESTASAARSYRIRSAGLSDWCLMGKSDKALRMMFHMLDITAVD